MNSPYEGLPPENWEDVTRKLVAQHPLEMTELYEIVSKVWDDIFSSGIGSKPFRIGVDLFPRPQIMGYFLHELIPLELEFRYPEIWRREITSDEKDVVFVLNPTFSVEIKTSSSTRSIYGNRSYAQVGDTSKKSKSGYYLAINFEKFTSNMKQPKITLVRFGWLDHEDWVGQTAATGQQSRLSRDVELKKLLTISF